MGPLISQLGNAVVQALSQFSNTTAARYLVNRAVQEIAKKL